MFQAAAEDSDAAAEDVEVDSAVAVINFFLSSLLAPSPVPTLVQVLPLRFG